MTQNDYEIWLEYTKSVKKLNNRNTVPSHSREITKNIKSTSKNWPINEIVVPHRSAPIEHMHKKEKRKFYEESRIDLHGFTKDRIFKELEKFCAKCISVNIRNVIVITGKGDGVVKQETMLWISSSPTYVVSFFPIYDSRREVGAFAIRLRKV